MGLVMSHILPVDPREKDDSAQSAAIHFAARTVPLWQAALGSELLGAYLMPGPWRIQPTLQRHRYRSGDAVGTVGADARSCAKRGGSAVGRLGTQAIRVLD